MSQYLTTALLWFSALGCGLMAGVYFAFSAFVMTAFGRIEPSAAIAAMNAINAVILRSLFMPLFFATTLTAAALAVLAVFHWGEPGATAMLAGGIIYVLGMFVVTVVCNVPLNNALMDADADSAAGAAIWTRYLHDWTAWNTVRTVTSLAASVSFMIALVVK